MFGFGVTRSTVRHPAPADGVTLGGVALIFCRCRFTIVRAAALLYCCSGLVGGWWVHYVGYLFRAVGGGLYFL